MKSSQVVLLVIAFISAMVIAGIMGKSCNDERDDVTNEVNKNGSIESYIDVEHIGDSVDVLVTRYKVWVNNNVYKDVYHRDTLPSLGKHFTIAENESGDEENVEVQKDYEVYITVK